MRIKGRQITGLVAAVVGLALCAQVAPAAAACTNEALREAQVSESFPSGTTSLPRCMALEQVSQSKKFNQFAAGISFGTEGSSALYTSTAALANTEGLRNYGGDFYVATRGAGGWSTTATAPPRAFEISNGARFGNPLAFSPDLGKWALLGASQEENMVGVGQLFNGGVDGSFDPLSPRLVPTDNSGGYNLIFTVTNTEIGGASADAETVVFSVKMPSTTYLPGDPSSIAETNPGGDKNQYVAFLDDGGQPALELLARDRFGTIHGGHCGTHVGGGLGSTDVTRGRGLLDQGAISGDGSRIFFTTRPDQAAGIECSEANPFRILERNTTPNGPEIVELIPDGPATGDDLYQAASVDGSRIYLITTRQLAASDQDSGAACEGEPGSSLGCDLYLYDKEKPPSERLTQVSAGELGSPTPGTGADVLSSITAVSGDGSHAYFVAEGVLTTDLNPEGDSAAAGQPNLYLYRRDAAHPDGDLAFVGTLVSDDQESLWGSERTFVDAYAVPQRGEGPGGIEVGGDGHILLFASAAPLTDDDTDGGERDVFRYDSEAGTLERISKAAAGGSETPSGDVAVNPTTGGNALQNLAEEGRWASEDGETVVFASSEPLSPLDQDGFDDAYVWTPEGLAMLPSDLEAMPKQVLPTVSVDGAQVGFTTELPLVWSDGDRARDVYVARVDGGFAAPPEPTPCDPLGGGCQASSAGAPTPPVAASRSFSGSGNVKLQAKKPKCKKGFVRKQGKCVKKKTKKKRAGHRRGGSK